MKRPALLWWLIVWLLILAGGGLYGGITMLLDPSGRLLGMAEVLGLLPVSSYFLPGLFLIAVMGVFPLLLVYALLKQPQIPLLGLLSQQTNYHWSWIATLLLVAILAIWLVVQGAMIGFQWPIQYITALNGLLIAIFTCLPSVRKAYQHTHLS